MQESIPTVTLLLILMAFGREAREETTELHLL